MKSKKRQYCINCSKTDHYIKFCPHPITSHGVILFRIKDNDLIEIESKLFDEFVMIDNFTISIENMDDVEIFSYIKNKIEFLLVQRKHTLGFLEFIRGRYIVDKCDEISYLFKQMTPDEINKIKSSEFDELWDEVWGVGKNKAQFSNEYTSSKSKFETLKRNRLSKLKGYSLDFYIDNIKPIWDSCEWGIPKGRRNRDESDKECAVREFKEETGLTNDDFTVLDQFGVFEETFMGTNNVKYKHIYHIALAISNINPIIDVNNIHQIYEIGSIQYMSYEEVIQNIRPYHDARLKLLSNLYIYIINIIIKATRNTNPTNQKVENIENIEIDIIDLQEKDQLDDKIDLSLKEELD